MSKRSKIIGAIIATAIAIVCAELSIAQGWTTINTSFGLYSSFSAKGNILVVANPYFWMTDPMDPYTSFILGSGDTYFLEANGDWSYSGNYVGPGLEDIQMGETVAVTSSRIAFGAPSVSKVYFFAMQGIDSGTLEGRANSKFGASLAMDDYLVAVGAPGDSSNKGSVSVYTITSDERWGLYKTLTPSATGALGTSIVLGPTMLLSGAVDEDGSKGFLYIWARPTENTIESSPQKISNPSASSVKFGQSVAIMSDTLIAVGTALGNVIYIFEFISSWKLSSTVNAPAGFNKFGKLLGSSSKYLLVGADNGALVYTRSGNGLLTKYSDITPKGYNFYGTPILSVGITEENAVVGIASLDTLIYRNIIPKISNITVPKKSKSEKLGYQVAIWNDIGIVSVPFCIVPLVCDGGYLVLYKKDSSSGEWKYLKIVRNPFRNRDNKFGSTITVNDNYLVISAPFSSYNNSDIGIAVFFKWDANAETFSKVSNARFRKTQQSVKMGSSISNMDDITIFGMPEYNKDQAITQVGCVLVMRRLVTGKWRGRVTITAATPTKGERFGHSVSLQSKTRFAVSNNPDSSSTATVLVLIYNFVNNVWVLSQTIPSEGISGFGWKIAFFSNLLYISAPTDSTNAPNAGSIRVYTDAGTLQYASDYTVKPNESINGGRFGYSFSFDDTRLAAGAKPCDGGVACNIPGRVYTFTKNSGGKWSQQYNFESPVADGSDGYGHDAAVKGDTVLVSAPTDSTSAGRKGIAYFIQL